MLWKILNQIYQIMNDKLIVDLLMEIRNEKEGESKFPVAVL